MSNALDAIMTVNCKRRSSWGKGIVNSYETEAQEPLFRLATKSNNNTTIINIVSGVGAPRFAWLLERLLLFVGGIV